MKTKLLASCFTAAAFALSGTASATVLGLPGGSLITTWDTFPGFAFTGLATTSSDANISATLSSTMAGGIRAGAGDRIYAFGNAIAMTVDGTTNVDLTEITLVMKFTAPSIGTAENYFTVSFNGATGSTPALLTTSLEGSNDFQIYTWTWTGLDLEAGDALNFTINGAADHVSVDAIQVVPEPSTSLLGSMAAAMLVIRRRRI